MIPAEVGLAYCNKLFFLEKQFRDLTPEERKDRRLETEVPVWESFYAWLEQLNPVKRSKLEKAVIYAKNIKKHCVIIFRMDVAKYRIIQRNHCLFKAKDTKGQWTIRWIIHRLRFTNFPKPSHIQSN